MAPKFRLGSSPGKENALALPNTPDGKKKQSGESIERQGFSGDEEYEDDFEIDLDADAYILTGSKYSVYDDIAWIQHLQKHL